MSRIMYVKCDRCGKQFIPDTTHRVGFIGFKWRDIETDDLLDDVNPFEEKDFCERCMEDIGRYIEGTAIEEEAPPEVEIVVNEPPAAEEDREAPQKAEEPPEPKKPKKNPPKAKGIDKGKIKALHDAGWNASKIADEMGVSPQTINYHLRRILYGGDADDRNGESEA
jgi:hypothetical protein